MVKVIAMEAYSGDESNSASLLFSHDAASHATIDVHAERGLEVFVIFTDGPGTRAALGLVDGMAQKLAAHIQLLVPCEVPYALPLDKPPVPVEFLEGQIRSMVNATRLEVTAQICLCRDKRCVLESLLGPSSLIVVGGKKRWWQTSAQKFAHRLEKDGHRVIFADQR
jgi:hypothetical protein